MKICTNENCPAINCARKLVLDDTPENSVRFEFDIYQDHNKSILKTVYCGELVGFGCDGYIFSVTA